ncbi:glyoxylate/hydroxypyruvate reductase A [Kordiimonas sediminis]|uniref:Glyoxylate/hydroxypyruvate reductase A n=1 Tax=Kordiimonas sediminis TaxID=1735581 RepID=A0A919ARA8_9PROT|nr:glyoxylate/hydroxypyruvate reductase A [Kordiimonas sediminis]GHF23218.1 glyoxylate/hydroxypyruvate reductase A [Kordiimonas sediminis]
MTRILFFCERAEAAQWEEAFKKAAPELEFRNYPDWGIPDDGDAIAFVWQATPGLLKKYTNIRAIFSLGAGIDHLTSDPDLPTHLPIIRMGDDGLKEGMAEFAVWSVLTLHRRLLEVVENQRTANWFQFFAAAAADKRVGIMGYGALGKSAAKALLPFGYQINTWSRSPKETEEGITHYTGKDSFDAFLANTDYFVCLMPNTPETTDLLNKETFAKMPKGAGIINGGRGNLIVEQDLIEALDSGHLSGAVLDVFKKEPLTEDHPFWAHPKIMITPHIAAITRVDTAVEYVIRNLKRLNDGEKPENLLDLNRGY